MFTKNVKELIHTLLLLFKKDSDTLHYYTLACLKNMYEYYCGHYQNRTNSQLYAFSNPHRQLLQLETWILPNYHHLPTPNINKKLKRLFNEQTQILS